ncbi:MAG: DUF4310 family protein [Sporomusaceae bacterium]|nr:DUF4310 family protein [Sporomusaceae bacterium]
MQTEEKNTTGFWFSEMAFVLFVTMLAAGIFAGTHMFYLYRVGNFANLATLAMLDAGLKTGSFGVAAAFGSSFLFARVLEAPLVGILDIGGSLATGVGIGVPAILLSMGITAPLESFPAALATGAALGLAIGLIIVLIRKFTIANSGSTFGADVMMGAGNAAGRYLGPLIVISAASASIPIGIGSIAGAAAFYAWNKPIAGGAILGAMLLGFFFPLAGK